MEFLPIPEPWNIVYRYVFCIIYPDANLVFLLIIYIKNSIMAQEYLSMQTHKGFTLIELIIAIAVVAVMTGIASFYWRAYQDNTNLKTAAREIMSDIAACKQMATTAGTNYWLQFTDGSPDYSLNPTSCYTQTNAAEAKSLTNYGAGLTVTDTNFASDQVIFQPRGTLGSNTGRIILTNSRNSTATITVNITGRSYVDFSMQ